MAKLKYLKLPKKPKAGASVNQLSAWLKKVEDIRKENQARKRLNDDQERLSKRVAGIGSTYVIPSGSKIVRAARPKKKAAAKPARKKAVPKKAAKKRR